MNTILIKKITNPLSAYCPYMPRFSCHHDVAVVVVVDVVVVVVAVFVAVVCAVCWSFSLGMTVNPAPCVVFAGVYGFPDKKFLICVIPHISCMQLVLSFPRAAFVNCEIFSSHAGFFSYWVCMRSSHNHNSILYLAERLKLQASSLWLLAYSIILRKWSLYKKKQLLGIVFGRFL